MATETRAAPFVPERGGLRALAKAAAQCRGCDLYQHATQTVFGAGPTRAELVLVGEQPGDIEDRQGCSVRRTGRARVGPRSRRGGSSSRSRVSDQRGQALSVEGRRAW